MSLTWVRSMAIVGAAVLVVTGCATKGDLEGYATKSEVSSLHTESTQEMQSLRAEMQSLRSELMEEIRKAQDSARAAEESAAASAAASQRAADDARAASEKADAIFRKSVRK